MLVVLAIAIGFGIYSYGWTVTEIDLEKPQEELRQENVTRALRDLLSPRLFEQEYDVREISANFLMGCDTAEGEVEQPEANENGAIVRIEPACGSVGDIVHIEVSGFEARADTRIRWVPPEGQTRPREVIETGREEIVLDDDGDFSGSIEVPRIGASDGQIHKIAIRSAIPIGSPSFSEMTGLVFDAMVQTVFMALVATSVAVPIAGVLSFFAARNLMRPIRLSTGSLLVAFIALAIGLWLGDVFLTEVANFGLKLGKADVTLHDDSDTLSLAKALLAFVAPIVAIIGSALFMRYASEIKLEGLLDRARSIILKLVLTIAVVFIAAALGGLMILIGDQVIKLGEKLRTDDIQALIDAGRDLPGQAPPKWLWNLIAGGIVAIGRFSGILGELAELGAPFIGAVGGGFVLSAIASDIFAAPLRKVPLVVSHTLGAGLGFVGGGILLGAMGWLGLQAALLGLLSMLAAGILGGQLLVSVYKFLTPSGKRKRFNVNRIDDTIRWILFVVGFIVTAYITYNRLNVDRAVINGVIPPKSTTDLFGVTVIKYLIENAVIGAVLGGLLGGVNGVHATFPLGSTLYNISRALLNTIRSIEPLIMGLVFVIWVGIGPFAGVLALTLHSIASLGKLYSEQVENIDEGPIEALDSTGASRLQMIIYAVIPQIIPPYIAFTMYRWDINVRMSTIIGFVGGGGIGLLLQQQINLLRYRDAGVAVLAIAIVVSVLDYASASIRERLI
jgi:phosphonate ABC transporter permease subunit PhnE